MKSHTPTNTSTEASIGDKCHKTRLIESGNLPKYVISSSRTNYNEKPLNMKRSEKKRRDKSDLGEHFVPPDGGWGWLVAAASGVNILVTIPMTTQFGIIFLDHMSKLGISSSQLTSIINIQISVAALTGILNGPLFRRFTFRQVALFGSLLIFIGLSACVFADSFLFYCLSFSCFYGFGRGLIVSASSLAVNTYFKERRRTATSYQYTVAGLGPIVLPYVATFLLDYFGVQGTVLIFAGLSLNALPGALLYQPVKWNVKKQYKDAEASISQNKRDVYDVLLVQPVEPETPIFPPANNAWFGSKTSLSSASNRNRLGSWDKTQESTQLVDLKRLNSGDSIRSNSYSAKVRSFSISYSIKEVEHEDEDHDDQTNQESKEQNQNSKMQPDLQQLRDRESGKELQDEHERRKRLPWYMKVVIFFDLDLLRDITYVNLAVGLTLINFVEINFAVLTPFILSDFGFDNNEIAMAMSLLGTFDLIIRFLIPVITAKINLSNKTFFILGIFGMCVGRFFLSFTRNFYVMIGIFIWMGLNKAFRTVFWSIIIPDHVPLKRLPAAAGLQFLMAGLFSLAFGPLVGLIRDSTNFAFTLNLLNALSLSAIASWTIEAFVWKCKNKSKPVTEDLK